MSLYTFAGVRFDLTLRSDYMRALCRGYEAQAGSETPVSLCATDEDIERERKLEPRGNFGLWESTALYRKISMHMLNVDGFVFHCSALAIDGKAYLFTAVSGTGKSTHTALWRQEFGDRVTMINDDKPLLRLQNGHFEVYGTPWCGKEGIQTNTHAPLSGIAVLERSEVNSIRRVDNPYTMLPRLLNQTQRPTDGVALSKLLDLYDELLRTVPIYLLRVNMSAEAAHVAYEGMKGQTL